MASQNDGAAMQYTIAPNDSRRDAGLDGTAPFSHPSLGQALGNHLPPSAYHRPSEYRISPSPSPIHPHHAHQQQHVHPSGSSFTGSTSPQMTLKRKPASDAPMALQQQKRRRDTDDATTTNTDAYDAAQGAKHWTDDEKTKLFNWLMGPGQDEHWNAMRATKNSCLRDCAVQVFGNKKTYQALKGCYERNFNLFKQIYAFESWSHQMGGNVALGALSEADRLKEYERRLQGAKKAGGDVGNVTARTIDHWHRAGWYQLFYTRWHGDPATTKPTSTRTGMSQNPGGDDNDVDLDDTSLDFGESNLAALTNSHEPLTFINSQQPAPPPPPPPHHPSQQPLPHQHTHPPPHMPPPPPPPLPMSPHPIEHAMMPPMGNVVLPQGMINALMQFLQIQNQTGKMKLDYLRRREEREEKEATQRREIERARLEREQQEFEYTKHTANLKQKADRAIALLENPNVDPSVKAAAGEYLKKVFTAD